MDTVFPHRRRSTWTANQFPGASVTGGTAKMPYENLGPYAGEHIEIGSELSAEAPVWKAYVLESDRQDKEMCDDWDRSLDVLLVFAALFSAISTAFILESMKKLQPDPADTTASTLLDISRTLVAISNGQSPPLPNTTTSEPTPFTPSPATILINSLWFASLALSLSVSLMAMLAKKWCHKFMSKRSGPHHEQARRRQMRWDGILRWRMQGVMDVLPALMHIALVLFVVGLVVLLWDTNQQVALPVVVISSAFFTLYVAITILPTISISCPYETALSEAFKWLLLVPACILLGALAILLFVVSLVIAMWGCFQYRLSLPSALTRVTSKISIDPLPKIQRLMHLIKLRPLLSSMDERHSSKIPMDDTTSGALYWLIANSEHGDHVNIGLQAISGAELHLPMSVLRKGWIIDQIKTQLQIRCAGAMEGNSASSPAGHHRILVSLFRAISRVLATDPMCNGEWDGNSMCQLWNYGEELENNIKSTLPVYEFLNRYHDSELPNDEVAAHNAAAAMMIYHPNRPFDLTSSGNSLLRATKEAMSCAILIAKRQLNGDIVLNSSALMALCEGFMYFIPGAILDRRGGLRVMEALGVLIRIYLRQQDTSSERLRYTIAVALASAALAFHRKSTNRYIITTGRTYDIDPRPTLKFIHEYVHKGGARVNDPKVAQGLFVFGLTRMLPRIGYSTLQNDLKAVLDACKAVVPNEYSRKNCDSIVPVSILEPPLPWRDHMARTIMTCLQQLPVVSESSSTEIIILQYLEALSDRRRIECPTAEPNSDWVKGLCNVRSDKLWDFGLRFFKLLPGLGETALGRMGQCSVMNQLHEVSRNSESPVSPQAMRRLLELIKAVVECEGVAPESIESAFGSLKDSIEFPSAPAEVVNKLKLEEIWYDRLNIMIFSESAEEVDGTIIEKMINNYIPEESVREKWEKLGRRLQVKKETAGRKTTEPETVEEDSAGVDSANSWDQVPSKGEECFLPHWGLDY